MRSSCNIFLLLLVAAFAGRLDAQRAIPDDNLGYAVLINLSDCSNNIPNAQGTGFFLNDGSGNYFVTARHILFNESERISPNQARPLQCNKAELISYSRNPKERQQNHIQLDLRALSANGRVRAHATHDVAVVQIAVLERVSGPEVKDADKVEWRAHPLPGAVFSQIAPSGILGASIDALKKLDEVLTANDIYVMGYPSSIGIQQAPQIDYSAPLLRKGIVAGINHSNHTLVLDCLTFFGNSGGPVVQAVHVGLSTRFDVVGVVSQYVPFTETWVNATVKYGYQQVHNSGYSIAEPMDAVLELIGK